MIGKLCIYLNHIHINHLLNFCSLYSAIIFIFFNLQTLLIKILLQINKH